MIDSAMYQLSLDGCTSECGDVSTVGWYGLLVARDETGLVMRPQGFANPEGIDTTEAENEFLKLQAACIISEDSQGFVSVEYFEDANKAEAAYSAIEAECAMAEEENEL